jgi:hypothetical protein
MKRGCDANTRATAPRKRVKAKGAGKVTHPPVEPAVLSALGLPAGIWEERYLLQLFLEYLYDSEVCLLIDASKGLGSRFQDLDDYWIAKGGADLLHPRVVGSWKKCNTPFQQWFVPFGKTFNTDGRPLLTDKAVPRRHHKWCDVCSRTLLKRTDHDAFARRQKWKWEECFLCKENPMVSLEAFPCDADAFESLGLAPDTASTLVDLVGEGHTITLGHGLEERSTRDHRLRKAFGLPPGCTLDFLLADAPRVPSLVFRRPGGTTVQFGNEFGVTFAAELRDVVSDVLASHFCTDKQTGKDLLEQCRLPTASDFIRLSEKLAALVLIPFTLAESRSAQLTPNGSKPLHVSHKELTWSELQYWRFKHLRHQNINGELPMKAAYAFAFRKMLVHHQNQALGKMAAVDEAASLCHFFRYLFPQGDHAFLRKVVQNVAPLLPLQEREFMNAFEADPRVKMLLKRLEARLEGVVVKALHQCLGVEEAKSKLLAQEWIHEVDTAVLVGESPDVHVHEGAKLEFKN